VNGETSAEPYISIIVPVFDERESLRLLHEKISAVTMQLGHCYEVIYVDDGSTDGTFAEIRRLEENGFPHVRVIRHLASVGQSTAILSGVYAARGGWIVTLDADGQNDPADIPALLDLARNLPAGGHFCIAGHRKMRRDTAWKRFQSQVANAVRSRLLKDGTPDTPFTSLAFLRKFRRR